MLRSLRRPIVLLLAAVCVLPVAGCGKKGEDKAPSSQILARVNGDEISVHQLNLLLSSQPGLAGASAEVRRKALERLVDRQLVYRQALKEEVDRLPEVALAIEEAKREIIAAAYARRLARGQAKPGEDEAQQYYAGHPELFAQRKVYRLRELSLASGNPEVAAVKSALAQGQGLEAVAAGLQARNARFNATVSTRAAEQLPMDALPRLAAAGAGQVVVYEAPDALLAYQVLESRVVPVDLAEALPRIKEYLANQQAARVIEAETQKLRAGAGIEYLGEPAPATPAATQAPAVAPQPADTETRGIAAGLK